jgi:hypothetical protein
MRIRTLLAAVAIAAGTVALGPSTALAALGVPGTITHQGRLYDAGGKPVNGTVQVVFSIYDDPAATTPVWTETDQVTFDEGYFSVSLGETTAFTAGTFNGSVRYFGVQVGADPEMTPRVPVQSVPYAMVSGDAIGDIHPSSVSIGSKAVIDANGKWVGDMAGIQGPQGPQGPQGLQGPQGTAGAVGPVGPTGTAGAIGPTGPIGPTGSQGVAGSAGPAGAQGPAGPTGSVGPIGPTGSQGVQGIQGLQGPAGPAGANGANGATGANGANGATGATGPVGPTGAIGVVSSTYAFSGTNYVPNLGSSNVGWLSAAQVAVNVTTGQKVHVVGHLGFGAAATAATQLVLFICYKTSAGALTVLDGATGGGMGYYSVPANTTVTFSISAAIPSLTTNTYTIGLCGYAGVNPSAWANSAGAYVSAVVMN